MGTKKISILTVLLCFLALHFWGVTGSAEVQTVPSVIVEFQQGQLFIQAEGAALRSVLDEIEGRCRVKILGLESRENEKVSFSSEQGMLEKELREFLGHLGVKNYAFEFVDEKLSRVLVFPEAKGEISSISEPVKRAPIQKVFVTVPQVRKIIEGSQAEYLDIREKDMIVEYDGVPIGTIQELVAETKKRTEYEQIEMIILREGEPLRIVLSGGFIGVRISTIEVSKEKLSGYYSGRY